MVRRGRDCQTPSRPSRRPRRRPDATDRSPAQLVALRPGCQRTQPVHGRPPRHRPICPVRGHWGIIHACPNRFNTPEEGTMKSPNSSPESHPLTVAVVGATGLIGQMMLTLLTEREFPVGELRPLPRPRTAAPSRLPAASGRSARPRRTPSRASISRSSPPVAARARCSRPRPRSAARW